MLARTFAPALIGVQGQVVSIECDIANGLPGISIVGLGDKAIEEARERVRSAIKNCGLLLPPKRLTLNLAPADVHKDGSGYDLGIAMAILAASGQIDPLAISDSLFLGELALDGTIRAVKGAAIAAQLSSGQAIRRLYVPLANAPEATLLGDLKVFAVGSLLELYQHLTGYRLLSVAKDTTNIPVPPVSPLIDLQNIYGQRQAKRALEIAAAGGHNLIMSGPPGAGKSLLAKALIGILPILTTEEKVEITVLHNLAGQSQGIVHERPFRSPHHTSSSTSLIGGGTRPRPGEISLSHSGILFLDELPEFPRPVLEVLRQPLEDGSITVARAAGVVTFPARFMLVGTLNPCPCGYLGNPRCKCGPASIASYQRKLSGPLLDRIDLFIEVNPPDQAELIRRQGHESSATVADRVQTARDIQTQRLSGSEARCNAQMSNHDLEMYCKLSNKVEAFAAQATTALSLSARGLNRIIKIARTIADLAGSDDIEPQHFSEAAGYRPKLAA